MLIKLNLYLKGAGTARRAGRCRHSRPEYLIGPISQSLTGCLAGVKMLYGKPSRVSVKVNNIGFGRVGQ